MQIERIEALHTLSDLKQRYLEQTTAPLDGMWLHGFVPAAAHYGWRERGQLCGYFCLNDEGYLLQFLVEGRSGAKEAEVFENVVGGESAAGEINGAFVSTAEPHPLSLCLDHFGRFEVNALMYELPDSSRRATDSLELVRLAPAQLPTAVAFAMAEIDAPQEWVTGYYANLIDRSELYGSFRDDRLVATGESRRREDDHADLGVIVARSERGQGLATKILSTLADMNDRAKLKSICSTEKDNRAAQKAIERAGFVAHNRIIRFDA